MAKNAINLARLFSRRRLLGNMIAGATASVLAGAGRARRPLPARAQ